MHFRGLATGAAASVLAASVALPATLAPTTAGASAATSRHRAAAASSGVHAAVSGSPPVIIGVDNGAPAGKNWEYLHYFPENGVDVPQGGLILFKWNQSSANGLHSVTFVPTGSSEPAERAARPTFTKDIDNSENDIVTPAVTNNGTDPTCSTGPTAPPCVFDGTKTVSSGIIPTSTEAAFAVTVAPQVAPGTYTYFCVIHPGMKGTINVVPSANQATPPATVQANAAGELGQLNNIASAAEAAASVPTSAANPDGSRAWTVHVGVSADDVELLEYLPANLPIRKGDSVNFDGSATSQEPHTVTTPAAGGGPGGAPLLPFLPNQCEASAGSDTPAAQVNGPPQKGCADPNGLEQPFNIGLQGEPNVIASGDKTATSAFVTGRGDLNGLGAPKSHTYAVPNNGTYQFFCFFHSNMGGVVNTAGYRLGGSDGGTFNFGASDFSGAALGSTSPVVATPSTFDHHGYWAVTADGHTSSFGRAAHVGNVGVHNGSPMVGAVATPDDGGLWLVAADGRVYPLGDAQFMGDLGGVKLAAPVVGVSADQSGNGYDLAAADGGVFTFGTGPSFGGPGSGPPPGRFFGSLGGTHLNRPVVGIADSLDGTGYYLVASDGGVFTFGSAEFHGSMGGTHLVSPIVGLALTASAVADPFAGQPGYRLVGADGGVFDFGDAQFFGSAASLHIHGAAIGITGS